MSPLVSIICPTYNHESFIAQAIEGFLMQKTNFDFEIIIHDDASTDKTREVVESYEKKHSQKFRNIYQTENQFSKDTSSVSRIMFAHAKGKYFALCEGDDYWTDPLKLQKQVDFMEANPGVSLCGHNANELINGIIHDKLRKKKKISYVSVAEMVINGNPFHTASFFLRKSILPLPDWFKKLKFGDYPLCFHAIKNGKIAILPDNMSVYRVHEGGVWSSYNNFPSGLIRNAKATLRFHQLLNKHQELSRIDTILNAIRILELKLLILKIYSGRHSRLNLWVRTRFMLPVYFIRTCYKIIIYVNNESN